MKNFKASRRYAKAVMFLFNDNDNYIILRDNFNYFCSFIKKNEDIFLFLKNPIIRINDKVKTLDLCFSNFSLNLVFVNFVKILIFKKRIDLLFEIHEHLLNIINEKIDVVKINLFSNVLLEIDIKNKFLETMENIFKKKIILNETLDPNILGGIKLSFRDIILDGTINNSFSILKKKIINENFLEATIWI